MAEDLNDMIPADPEKKFPASLDVHLRSIMPDNELDSFREQLPAEFLSDASEGLDHLRDKKQLETVLHQLNQQMHQHLTHKKTNKRKRSIGFLNWIYWAIIIIILLAVVGFVVVRMFLRN